MSLMLLGSGGVPVAYSIPAVTWRARSIDETGLILTITFSEGVTNEQSYPSIMIDGVAGTCTTASGDSSSVWTYNVANESGAPICATQEVLVSFAAGNYAAVGGENPGGLTPAMVDRLATNGSAVAMTRIYTGVSVQPDILTWSADTAILIRRGNDVYVSDLTTTTLAGGTDALDGTFDLTPLTALSIFSLSPGTVTAINALGCPLTHSSVASQALSSAQLGLLVAACLAGGQSGGMLDMTLQTPEAFLPASCSSALYSITADAWLAYYDGVANVTLYSGGTGICPEARWTVGDRAANDVTAFADFVHSGSSLVSVSVPFTTTSISALLTNTAATGESLDGTWDFSGLPFINYDADACNGYEYLNIEYARLNQAKVDAILSSWRAAGGRHTSLDGLTSLTRIINAASHPSDAAVTAIVNAAVGLPVRTRRPIGTPVVLNGTLTASTTPSAFPARQPGDTLIFVLFTRTAVSAGTGWGAIGGTAGWPGGTPLGVSVFRKSTDGDTDPISAARTGEYLIFTVPASETDATADPVFQAITPLTTAWGSSGGVNNGTGTTMLKADNMAAASQTTIDPNTFVFNIWACNSTTTVITPPATDNALHTFSRTTGEGDALTVSLSGNYWPNIWTPYGTRTATQTESTKWVASMIRCG